MNEKPTIFLLSDSTVQSYESFYRPQTGWGQVFFENFRGSSQMKESTPAHCSYPQGRAYCLPELTIENRAIGGRSSRSFIEEGKLAEVAFVMKPGDYVFVQFGHNDATEMRPARYVPADLFADYLAVYADTCRKKGAQCVFVTPIARRNCLEMEVLSGKDTESDEPFKISFPEYRTQMIRFAKDQGLPLLDLGRTSTEYLNQIGREQSRKLYLHTSKGEYSGAYAEGVEDNTHLSLTGARIYSRMVANLMAENGLLAELSALLL